MNLLIVLLVVFLLRVLVSVFAMLAVGADAKGLDIKNRGLWMALTFLFPIAGFIYLALRKSLDRNSPRFCVNCKTIASPTQLYCMNCGFARFDYMLRNDNKKQSKKGATLAIIACVLMGLCFITGTVGVVAGAVKDFDDIFDSPKYHQEYEDDYDEPDTFDNPYDFFNDFEDKAE